MDKGGEDFAITAVFTSKSDDDFRNYIDVGANFRNSDGSFTEAV
jgi:hypothetical protein